ncbi:hypothetical protein M3N64_09505 [Sporolactobacillus sp. CPB3-1]|uniref:Calcineurin-like phosphoesterase domain-containing protein n=1 Tax=Sporolactobacillus mangiferae TaxID=2940498 RepID=A0ABT0MBD1_9BACL|nr:hypothetical protein [Sporolactobacillus mangiferae]MCL1632177.1 hypothetical protein [Sporolactobacillus mangiferae]
MCRRLKRREGCIDAGNQGRAHAKNTIEQTPLDTTRVVGHAERMPGACQLYHGHTHERFAEYLCRSALITTPVIQSLTPYFKRNYWASSAHLYAGHYNHPTYSVVRSSGRVRTTVRFLEKDYRRIEKLAYVRIVHHAVCSCFSQAPN